MSEFMLMDAPDTVGVARLIERLRTEGYGADTYGLREGEYRLRTNAADDVVTGFAHSYGVGLAFNKNPSVPVLAHKGDFLVLELRQRTTGIRYASSETILYVPAIAAKVDKQGRVTAYITVPGQKKPTPVTGAERVMVVSNSAAWAQAAFDSFEWPTIWDSIDEARAAIQPFVSSRSNPALLVLPNPRNPKKPMRLPYHIKSIADEAARLVRTMGRPGALTSAMAYYERYKAERNADMAKVWKAISDYIAKHRWEDNPREPCGGQLLSKRAVAIRYMHLDDGNPYEHIFKKGVHIEFLADGSARLYRPDGRPLWGDF